MRLRAVGRGLDRLQRLPPAVRGPQPDAADGPGTRDAGAVLHPVGAQAGRGLLAGLADPQARRAHPRPAALRRAQALQRIVPDARLDLAVLPAVRLARRQRQGARGQGRRDAVGPLHRARASRRARSSASSAATTQSTGRDAAGAVVLRPLRARRGHDPRLAVHRGRHRRALGGPPDRGDQARAAVLELPSRRHVARLRGLRRRLRDGRPEQAHAADARHRPQDRRVSRLRRAGHRGRQLPARAARRAGEVRPQQHPVPDDAGGGREQAQHADREAGQVQESLGPRRAARRGPADRLRGAQRALRRLHAAPDLQRDARLLPRGEHQGAAAAAASAPTSFPELAMSPQGGLRGAGRATRSTTCRSTRSRAASRRRSR